MKRLWYSIFLCIILALIMSISVFATTSDEVVQLDLAQGSISISETDGITTYTQGETVVQSTAGCLITQTNSGSIATPNTITVDGGECKISIANLNIDSESPPIDICSGTLTLTLIGNNNLKNGDEGAAVHVPDCSAINIIGNGTLITDGGNYGAGIGGNNNENGGTITINNGIITAQGGPQGAGIGGGMHMNGGNITINGGSVTATGSYGAAGIGGGKWGGSGTIIINDGTVKATGSEYGSGIGSGGYYYEAGGDITIKGGNISATGGKYAAGIGGGFRCKGGTIKICNATVTAAGYYYAIGGGGIENQYACDAITVENATMSLSYIATGGSNYQEFIKDLSLPNDSASQIGGIPKLVSTATGYSGISYQWQFSSDGTTWKALDGHTTAVANVTVTAENSGYYYRCKITNIYGNVAYTSVTRLHELAFTQHPASVYANLGDLTVLEVISSCSNVTYQWQKSVDDGGSWSDLSDKISGVLAITADLNEDGNQYRCIITATNGDWLASDSATITIQTEDTTYSVTYYQQSVDGTEYYAVDREVIVAEIGSFVTAGSQSYDGFTENTAMGTHSGTVVADSSLTLSRYYDRNAYSIKFNTGGGSELPDLTTRYGATVCAPSAPTRYGYVFGGWYADEVLTEVFSFTTMPLNGCTLYAKWTPVGADRGIEYSINGIKLLTTSYEEIDSIPEGSFYTQVSVTNLSSTTVDTLILATYDADGRTIDLYFLYADPQIGQTFTLGALIDNSSGDVGEVKAFMISMLGGMAPLANSVSVKAT